MPLLFNLRHVIQIPSFRIVNLLCCGGHLGSTTFIDAKTKYRSPYLLDFSQPYLQDHIRTSLERPRDVSEGPPQDVGRTSLLELQIRPYGNVLVPSSRKSSRCRQGTSLALHIGHYGDILRKLHWDVFRMSYLNVQRTSVEDVLRTSAGDFPWRYIEDHMGTSIGHILGTSSGRPREIILPSGK